MILDIVYAFIKSEMSNDIEDVSLNITALNNTIKNLTVQANVQYEMLKQHQSKVLDYFISISFLKPSATEDLSDANFAKILSDMALDSLGNTTSFVSNLSTVLRSAENQAVILQNDTLVLEENIDELDDVLDDLNDGLVALNADLSSIVTMINTLLGSAATAKMKVDTNLASVHSLMVS